MILNMELRQRLIAAGFAIAIILSVVLLLPDEATFALALGASLQAWREYSRMMGLTARPLLHQFGFLWLTLAMTISYFAGLGGGAFGLSWIWLWLAFFGAFFLLGVESLGFKQSMNVDAAWRDLCRFVMGVCYLFLIFGFIGPVMGLPHGLQILITGIASIAIADTTAYFVGKRWGRQKFWPEISPGKTWEGVYGSLAGGVVGALLTWLIFFALSQRYFGFGGTLTIGILVGPLSIMGDLLESLMKRASGTKDSGSLMPGHGGILDRADGLALVIPVLYFLF
jgi:phosphatidate cytidylyltransferase